MEICFIKTKVFGLFNNNVLEKNFIKLFSLWEEKHKGILYMFSLCNFKKKEILKSLSFLPDWADEKSSFAFVVFWIPKSSHNYAVNC